MRGITRKLILITILLSGTQVIELPGIGLSLFQIALIISGIVAILSLFSIKIKLKSYLVFAIIYALGSCLAFVTSTNPSWARSYLLLGLMSAVFAMIIPCYFDNNDIRLLEKTLIRSQYIVYPFSLYSLYMYYFKGGLPSHISLFAGMYIDLDADAMARSQAASQIRLVLPYATPPVLSVVMAMSIMLLVGDKGLYDKKIQMVLLLLDSIVLIMTNSRTGLMALVGFGIIYLITNKKHRRFSGSVVIKTLIMLLFLVIALLAVSKTNYFRVFMLRIKAMELSVLLQSRHFWVPVDGLIIWLSSVKRFIVGIGLGSSINMVGEHTFLPPYFLNSFVTLCVERGLVGMITVILLLKLAVDLYKQRKVVGNDIKAVSFAYIVGLVACLFYEIINCYFLIFIISLAYTINSYKKEISGFKMEACR